MKLAEMLTGGDPRSLGRTEEVVTLVLADRSRLGELFDCLGLTDEIVRMRAGDALEKVCRQQPEWFKPYKTRLLNEVSKINQPSVQWHLAQMFGELDLAEAERRQAIQIMKRNLRTSHDWIVTNLTIEALAGFTRQGHVPRAEFVKILRIHQNSRHKSVTHRVNKLLTEFAPS